MAQLTPLIMMAGQGILDNSALALPSEFGAAMSTYISQPFIAQFNATLNVLSSNIYDPVDNLMGISAAHAPSFVSTMMRIPYFINRLPLSYAGTIDGTTSYSTFINNHRSNLYSPSNGEFVLYLQTANGFIDQANAFINSAANGQTLATQTFVSMDALATGNITLVNSDVHTWGADLQKTGMLYNFARLDILGTPHALLLSLMAANLLPNIADELNAVGIDVFELQTALDDNPDGIMKPVAQKRCYSAFINVTGTPLQDLLYVLGVTTSGLSSLADLLNPIKMFPNSYATLTSLNSGTVENIYTNGVVSPYVSNIDTEFAVVVPAEIAKANAAFSVALQQIKRIHEISPADLAEQALNIELSNDLTDVAAMSSPLPLDTASFYQGFMGNGSGPNGTFYLTDFFGTILGVPHVDSLGIINAFFGTGYLTPVYDIMVTLAGLPGLMDQLSLTEPGDTDAAITAALSDLDAAVTSLLSIHATAIALVETAQIDSINQVLLELNLLAGSMIQFENTYVTSLNVSADLAGLKASTSSTLAFAENLHTFGVKNDPTGIAFILTSLSNTATRGGQSIIGALREGRNLQKLADIGIGTDAVISDQP